MHSPTCRWAVGRLGCSPPHRADLHSGPADTSGNCHRRRRPLCSSLRTLASQCILRNCRPLCSSVLGTSVCTVQCSMYSLRSPKRSSNPARTLQAPRRLRHTAQLVVATSLEHNFFLVVRTAYRLFVGMSEPQNLDDKEPCRFVHIVVERTALSSCAVAVRR